MEVRERGSGKGHDGKWGRMGGKTFRDEKEKRKKRKIKEKKGEARKKEKGQEKGIEVGGGGEGRLEGKKA
jgi:hypothetical protein